MDKIARVRQEIERNRQAIRVLNEHTAPEMMSKTCAIFQYSDSILSKLLSFLDTLSEEPTHTEYNDARVDLSKFDDDIRDFGEGFCEDKPKSYWDGVYEALEVMRSWGKLVKNIYEEPDKSLEEAAGEQAKSFGYMSQDVEFKENVESFIAGWKCRDDQMPMPEDTVLFNKGVAEGRRLEREDMMKDGNVILAEEDFDAEKEKSTEWGYNLCKEQMLKDAVEGEVYLYYSYKRKSTAILVDIPIENLGDKVKVIVLKDNENESK